MRTKIQKLKAAASLERGKGVEEEKENLSEKSFPRWTDVFDLSSMASLNRILPHHSHEEF